MILATVPLVSSLSQATQRPITGVQLFGTPSRQPGSQNVRMSFMSRVFFLLVVAVSPGAHAWWGNGHEQVADIAWTRLKPLAKSEIAEILKAGDVDFRPKSDEEKDVRAAFRKAATWSDWAKDHKEGTFEDWIIAWNAKFQPGYDPKDANREAHRCKRWHYFDIPIRYKGEKPGVEGSNALIALTTARYEFAIMGRQEPKDRKGQCWWLYWITHVVGDLHQPLHCVSSYEFEANGDAGGNLFKLGIGFPDNPDRKMNLHALWDSGVETAIAVETWPIQVQRLCLSDGLPHVLQLQTKCQTWTSQAGSHEGQNLPRSSPIRGSSVTVFLRRITSLNSWIFAENRPCLRVSILRKRSTDYWPLRAA